jgi:WD40 repeat protein
MSDGEVPYSVSAAAFDPTRHHGAAAVSDGTVFVWNLATGSTREVTVDPDVAAIAVGPMGDRVALAGDRLELWALAEEPADSRPVPLDAFAARTAVFSADGRHLAAASSSEIRVYDASRSRVLRRLRIAGDVGGLVFSGDGAALAVADDARLRVWRWQESGGAPRTIATERGAIGAPTLGDHDRLIAYVVDQREVVVRDVATGQELARLRQEADVLALAFDADGGHLGLASADGDALVVLWRPSDLMREAQRRTSDARR